MSKAVTLESPARAIRTLLNPYIAGNPVKGQDGFFGRDDIFREVMQVLRHRQSNAIVLYGQRRIGKTSVLLELERRLASDGEFTPIYFDLQDKAAKPLAEVLYELAQRIAAKTGQVPPERANFDNAGGYFRQTFLPTAAEAAAHSGLVLLFDEFDVLDGPAQGQAGKAFFPYLRAWMSEIERVHFVFVIGRRPEDLSIETMSTFKGIRAARVSLFEREEAEAVMRKSERDGSLVWSDAACEKVWYWAQGHPYFTQLLCSVMWENAHDTDRPPALGVAASDVDAAIDDALQQGSNAFHWLWAGLPPAERVVTAAMAEDSDGVITRKEMVEILIHSGVRLIVRELELAPETLVDWGLLRSVDSGYRFVVPLLRRWVAINKPLRRVKDELDHLDPLAEGLFQTGQRFYSLDQSAEAESQLQRALQINPNHLKARLLLGRVLLEDGRVAEAVTTLEEAYRYDEGSARADLVRALLAMADGQAEAEQLATYERILKIDPHQPIAGERRRAIWITRGEAAQEQDDLETAVEAFQEAGALERVEQIQELKRKRDRKNLIALFSKYEAEEEWEAAIRCYEALIREYPDETEWRMRLDNTRLQIELMQLYEKAIDALKSGDNKTAQRLLADVIFRQPDYREAAMYLLGATSGVKVGEIRSSIKLLTEKADYSKTEVIGAYSHQLGNDRAATSRKGTDRAKLYSKIIERYATFFDRPEARLRFLINTFAKQSERQAQLQQSLRHLRFLERTRFYDRVLEACFYSVILEELRALKPSLPSNQQNILGLINVPLSARILIFFYEVLPLACMVVLMVITMMLIIRFLEVLATK